MSDVPISGAIGYFYYKYKEKLIWILEDNHSNQVYCSSKKFTDQSSLIGIFRICSNQNLWRIVIEEPEDEFKNLAILVNEFNIPHVNEMREFKQTNIEKRDIRFHPKLQFEFLTEERIRTLIKPYNIPLLLKIQNKIVEAYKYCLDSSGETEEDFYANYYDSVYNWVCKDQNILAK